MAIALIDQPLVRSACASTQFSHANIGTGPFDGLQLYGQAAASKGLRHLSRNSDGGSPSGEVDLAGARSLKRAGAPYLDKYAGQQMLTSKQAEVYADHFIAVHLKEAGGGQTYAQLSAKALADPTKTKLAGQVATAFQGETLRGLLLNAYAFGTMGAIAGIAASASFIAAGVLLLCGLGFWHQGRTPRDAELLGGPARRSTAATGVR